MKLLRIVHTLMGVALIAYLLFYWLQWGINFAYSGSLVTLFGVCFLLFITVILYKARQLDSLYNKRIMLWWWVVLILLAYRWFTDNHTFWWSDVSIVFWVITFFFALFGTFNTGKGDIVKNKGVYTKKTEIIEV